MEPAPAQAPKPSFETITAPPPEPPPMLAAPPAAPKLPSGTVAGLGKDVADSYAGQQQAIQQRADVKSQEAAELAKMEQAKAAKVQEIADDTHARWQANQKGIDQYSQDIANSKIDPNQYWATKSTGAKFASLAAIILGGIGSRGQGQNMAMDVINKNIDNDIAAQKTNLAKKEGSLARYMQQGHDILEAGRLAKADALDVFAGQYQAMAAKFSGPEQQAAAMQQVAALKGEAAKARQGIYEEGLKTKLTALQVAGAQQALAGQGQANQLQAALNAGLVKDPRIIAALPDKERELYVRLPNGAFAKSAGNAEAAQKVRDSFKEMDSLRSKLQGFTGLMDSGSPRTFDRGTATAMREAIMLSINKLHDLSRINEFEAESFKKQVPDLTDLFQPGAAQKLQALGRSIDEKVSATIKNDLLLPDQQPANKNLVVRQ